MLKFLKNLFKSKPAKGGRYMRSTVGVLKPYDKEHIKNEWVQITALVSTSIPSARKEAVMRADKLLDYALRQISAGETMGDRLKNARQAFAYPVYDGLWKAHKVRNTFAHEVGYDPNHLVITEAISQFKRGFEELGVSLG